MGSKDGIESEDLEKESDGKTTPDQLADDLEAMEPTFVKLGQVLSSRPDLMKELVAEWSRIHCYLPVLEFGSPTALLSGESF